MIRAEQLTKAYADLQRGQFLALDHVSFSAAPGEVFGLLGPNGAGKTTALRILSTVLQPTSGIAEINGFDCLTQAPLVRHQIGFVSANTAVYERMTAWEMVEYFGRLYGMNDDVLYPRMEELFTKLQMQEIRDLLGAKMSTGMQQKVSIARAIIHDPPVVIFDEATNGLDVLVARALIETVAQLRDQGKCIIYSTHIMSEVERLCDRVAILHRGQVVAEGSIEQLRNEYNQKNLEDIFIDLLKQQEEQHTASSLERAENNS